MSLIKCNECGSEISSEAKSCPQCGAPIKVKKKGVGLLGWIFALAVLYFIISAVSNTGGSKNSNSGTASISTTHEQAKSYFKSSKEPKVKDAVWSSATDFRVGVIHDGTNRDGYAKYVCIILTGDFGLSGNNLHVGVYDIAKIANSGKWERIGRHYCSDK